MKIELDWEWIRAQIKKISKIVTELTLYASSLSFYTIFAFVPIILLILTIFASSPFFKEAYSRLEVFIASNILPSNQDVVLNYLRHFLENSGKTGIMGGIYIVITLILFVGNYESIVSKIFPQRPRPLWEKIKLYWTMFTLLPPLFFGAIYFSVKVQLILNSNTYTNWIHFQGFIPFIAVWTAFFISYAMTLENERIKSVFFASFITSALFFIAKTIFVYYTFVNHTYKTLYGSISLLLFLFLWIYINWLIFLGGIYLIRFFERIEREKRGMKREKKIKNYLLIP
jgi:membrane protein